MAGNMNIAEQAGPSCKWTDACAALRLLRAASAMFMLPAMSTWTWWLLDAICDVIVGAALRATIDLQQVKYQNIELYYCSNAIP